MYYQLPHKCTYKLQIIKSFYGLVDKTRNSEHKQLLNSQSVSYCKCEADICSITNPGT